MCVPCLLQYMGAGRSKSGVYIHKPGFAIGGILGWPIHPGQMCKKTSQLYQRKDMMINSGNIEQLGALEKEMFGACQCEDNRFS